MHILTLALEIKSLFTFTNKQSFAGKGPGKKASRTCFKNEILVPSPAILAHRSCPDFSEILVGGI